MNKLGQHPRLHQAVSGAAVSAAIIDWQEHFGLPEGACLPISIFTAAYLGEAGIHSRVTEAGARFTDPLSARYAEFSSGEPALSGRDESGLPFFGHCIVQVPTFKAVLDLSLPTQKSSVLSSLGAVEILVGEVDHTKGQVGFKTPFGRGEAIYRIYPKRDGWAKRDWPYADIRKAGRSAFHEFTNSQDIQFQEVER